MTRIYNNLIDQTAAEMIGLCACKKAAGKSHVIKHQHKMKLKLTQFFSQINTNRQYA